MVPGSSNAPSGVWFLNPLMYRQLIRHSGVEKVNKSLGIVEVIGVTTASACIDSMVKSAFVDVYNIKRLGSGMITIMIKGDLASVQVAVEIGAEVAQCHGELVAYRVIPRPYDGLEKLIAPEEKGVNTLK